MDKPNNIVIFNTFPEQYKKVLRCGEWSKLVGEKQTKVIIAVALNYYPSLLGSEVKIFAYTLISNNLYLVARGSDGDIYSFLPDFYELVQIGIQDFFSELQEQKVHFREQVSLDKITQVNNLFTEHRFRNNFLLSLIIGQKISLPYFDPKYNKLQHKIQTSNFSSAVDYSGAKGPVIIYKQWTYDEQ